MNNATPLFPPFRDPFIHIHPDLARQCEGYDRAAVVALIATRIERGDEHGRVHRDDDGTLWWRISQPDLADELGLSEGQVGRAIQWLRERGHIETRQFQLDPSRRTWDRTASVRVIYEEGQS